MQKTIYPAGTKMALSQEITKNDYVKLTYRRDLNILLTRWLKKVNSTELKAGYTESLTEAGKLNTNYWFFDLRRRGVISKTDEEWIINSFFSKAESTIKGNHYFAYLVSPTHYQQIDASVGIEAIKQFTSTISIRIFNSEDEAISWLLSVQKNTRQFS